MGLLESLFRLTHRRDVEMLAPLPGPRPIFLFGNALQLAGGDLHKLFERWRAEHGDFLRFWLFGQPSLFTARPELVADVLVDHESDWEKNVPRAATRPVGGESVFRSVGGAEWKEKRAAHPFEAPWVDAFYDAMYPVIRDATDARFAKLEGRVDLYQELLRTSWDCFSLGVFGERLPEAAFAEHETLLREVGRRGALPVAFSWSPVFWWRRRSWRARIAARMERGSLGEGAHDLVSTFARGGKRDMRSQLLRDELGNIFAAGMKNAAIAASATAFLVGKHPDVRARLVAELEAAGAGDGTLDRRTLVTLPYLDRVVKESLRLYPAVAGFVREVKKDREVSLGGVRLPPRTQIFFVSWVVHRHPGLWPDPERFDPDRFLTEPARGSYIPFGLGERYCVGREWTLLCAKAIVATLLTRHDVEIDPAADFDTTLVSSLTVPKNGVAATVRRRPRP
jgi:cytochrome P450